VKVSQVSASSIGATAFCEHPAYASEALLNIVWYDIFSGQFDKDAMWLEAVEGLGAACDKMNERAKKSPGPYFVFCQNANKVLAHINTRISENIQIRESA
jgi:hypothetical protein